MNDQKVKLTFGALLHDVGKVVYRGMSEKGTHSKLGADFVTEALGADAMPSKDIIDQVRYHHARDLANCSLSPHSLAYVTYFADNISAGMDRKNEGEDSGFDRSADLRRIFNLLGSGNDDNVLEHDDYNIIRERIKASLHGIPINERGIGSLLNLLEATCDRIPSSTDKSQLIDVSLFDHEKTTAAIACCMLDYLESHSVKDYQKALFDKASSSVYYDEQMFLLWACDLSGIQDFIYQISGSQALKQLRARSFYLEILLEHCMDELLTRVDLSRCNLLYTGGGHAYALLPNTKAVIDELDAFSRELKSWLIDHFRADLFCATAHVPCSANDLMNKGGTAEGSKRYRSLFREVANRLSAAKGNRYTAEEIFGLNFKRDRKDDHVRECNECHRSDANISDGLCPLCQSFASISPRLVRKDVFAIADEGDLELPFGKRLTTYNRDEYIARQPHVRRIYTKSWDTGIDLATHIWMGDYTADTSGVGISDYAAYGTTLNCDKGIKRLGVLRADIDNLGTVFSQGLPDDKISISRTATLSRSLSYFFKKKINDILASGKYRVQIIYSGGDDLFIIGNWSDTIAAARDIRRELDTFTGNGSLTISAGLGLYDPHYPLARMAEEVGVLEDAAKSHDGKNAIALWAEDAVFSWAAFENGVCEKLICIERVFNSNEKGRSFIYKLIDLLRNTDDPISIPRLAYLLARSFEDDRENGSSNSKLFFEWALEERDRKSLTTALEWYVYSIRERG